MEATTIHIAIISQAFEDRFVFKASPLRINFTVSLNYNSVMKFNFSVAQFHILPGNVKSNYQKALSSIDNAAASNSKLLVLPELFLTGYGTGKSPISPLSTSEYLLDLHHYAKIKQIYLAGTYAEEFEDQLFNTFFLDSSEGTRELSYQKIHLFEPMRETKLFQPGKQLKSVQNRFGHVGAAICFDLRFSGMFVKLRERGVNIFIIPAEWPMERIAHWEILLKARAVEMQAFVIASNCVGVSGSFVFGGQSMIVDPLGNILCKGDSVSEDVITTEIDNSLSDSIRSTFPTFRDRHPCDYA
jgi:omega-amidase